MQALVPCPSCRRHVRVAESACPFCRATFPNSLASSVIPGSNGRLTRAATWAFTATLALAGCSDSVAPVPPADSTPADLGPADNGTPTDNPVVTDRGTPTDNPVVTDRGTPTDNPAVTDRVVAADTTDVTDVTDTGGVAPLYGAPIDASVNDGSVVADTGFDSGGVAPLYGVAPVDSGVMVDRGSIMPLYGAVPADSGVRDETGGGVRYGAPPANLQSC